MRKNIVLLCCLLGILAKAQTREFEVNFATASATLDSEEINKLNHFLQSLPVPPKQCTVAVAGHTDNVGDIAYNAVLSNNRANVVADFFKSKGFPDERILTSGRGEVHPIASNESEKGKAKNRRVKIIVSLDLLKVNDIGGIQLKEAIYKIDPDTKQTVTYKSGTKIHIPENAFVDEKGKAVDGEVNLTYIEYRDPIDFILGNIPMDHGDGHFNSGGMYKILAYKDGKPVYLKKGKTIDIDFALTGDLPDLNFYSYDTITKKWTELRKLNDKNSEIDEIDGKSDTIASVQKATISNGIFYFNDQNQICGMKECDAVSKMVNSGIDFAKSKNSLYHKMVHFDQYKDSIIAANRKRNDSIFKQSGKILTPGAEKSIKDYELKIAEEKAQLQKIPQRIKKTIPYFLVSRIKNKSAILLKITLKAIYNIETVDYGRTKWSYIGSQPLDEGLFKTKWDFCEITGDNNDYTASLKNASGTKTINHLKIITESPDINALVTSLNNADEIQKAKLDKLEATKIKLTNDICSHYRQIDQLRDVSSNWDSCNIEDQQKIMSCFWEMNKKYMTVAEQTLSLEGWLQFFDSNKTTMAARYLGIDVNNECRKIAEAAIERQKQMNNAYKNSIAVTQSLSISSLGIYNCDQVARLREPLIVNANYRDENGKPLNPLFIYLVNNRINGILRYDGRIGYSPGHFAYSPTSKNTLLAFDGNGSYIINAEDFRKTTKEKKANFTFIMKKIKAVEDRTELTALF
jgi:hypothetical protein